MNALSDLALPFASPFAWPEAAGGSEDLRWIQDALNRLANASLAVDGMMGPATRAAIRAFQAAHGLAADGVPGPLTRAALRTALESGHAGGGGGGAPACTGLPERQSLSRFAFGQHRLEPEHEARAGEIAACLAASLQSRTPIEHLTLIGHTDPVGDDAANDALGLRRANAVAEAIRSRLEHLRPDASRVTFEVQTRGEREQVPGDPAENRRVEVVAPFAFPRRDEPPPPPPFRSPLDPPRWGPILARAIDPSAVLRAGNAVRYLVDAENPAHPALAGYAAMADAIRSASGGNSFIYLLGWICIDDFEMVTCDPSSQLRSLLFAAAARGVQVRAIFWQQSRLYPTNRAKTEASARRINALPGGAAIIDDETLSLGAHHQKLLVVGSAEQLVGFTGGLDVNSDRILPSTITCPPRPVVMHAEDGESLSGGGGEPLHDVHCRIEGPAAFDLLQTFIRRWDHHPDSRRIEAVAPLRGRSRGVPPPISAPSPAASATGGSCSVVVGRTFNPRRGSGMPCERNIQRMLLAAIRNARRFIYMEDQYLINPDAARALKAALPNINHLTIVIAASDINGDTPCIWTYRREFIATLTGGLPPDLLAKVRVFQLATPPLPAAVPPCSTHRRSFTPTFGRHTYVHAKCWVFDDELAVIGSANCNRRGWQHDSEIGAFIFDDRIPARAGDLTFAQRLRMDLWSEHLSLPAASFADGVASASAWLSPRPSARAVRYCPLDDHDIGEFKCGLMRDNVVDPPAPCGTS